MPTPLSLNTSCFFVAGIKKFLVNCSVGIKVRAILIGIMHTNEKLILIIKGDEPSLRESQGIFCFHTNSVKHAHEHPSLEER